MTAVRTCRMHPLLELVFMSTKARSLNHTLCRSQVRICEAYRRCKWSDAHGCSADRRCKPRGCPGNGNKTRLQIIGTVRENHVLATIPVLTHNAELKLIQIITETKRASCCALSFIMRLMPHPSPRPRPMQPVNKSSVHQSHREKADLDTQCTGRKRR